MFEPLKFYCTFLYFGICPGPSGFDTVCIFIYILFIFSANTRPGRPINVTLLADDHNIAVSWEPPPNYNGIIQRYIITWAILPNFTDVSYRNLVDGNLTVSFIAIKEDLGRLFRVRVRAASESGIGEYSLPRYIRIGNNPIGIPLGTQRWINTESICLFNVMTLIQR